MKKRDYLINKIKNSGKEEGFRASIDLIKRGLEVESDLKLLSEYLPEKYSNDLYYHEEKNKLFHDTFNESFRKFGHYEDFTKEYNGSLVIKNENMFRDYVDIRAKFFDDKINIQTKNCNNYAISKSEVIKCASSTDPKNQSLVDALIDKVWNNKYFDALFSLLAIFIAENNKFTFLFSEALETRLFSDHLESNYEFKIFIHESYHALQKLLFNGQEFYLNYFRHSPNHSTRDNFNKAFKETAVNMLKILSPEENDLEQYNLEQLMDILHQKMPELTLCKLHYNPSLFNEATFNNQTELSESQIAEQLKLAKIFVADGCLNLEKNYNISGHILERFSYIINTFKGNLSAKGDLSVEVMPITFELISSEIDENSLKIFAPMLNYFDTNVAPIIDSYKELHIEHYCEHLIDNQMQQCFQPLYADSVRCIVDFLE